MNHDPPEKICATCGRRFEWRRKWADVWADVRYCSKACRGGPGRLDLEAEALILDLARERGPGSSLCPSEVARAVFPEGEWRAGMERVRRAGRRLAHAGEIEVTQKGRVVDPGDARGPIRYRLPARRRNH